jgi:hypothetical protein
MDRRSSLDRHKTLFLAIVWAVTLTIGVSVSQLEIFLLFAPLSAGIYLLIPDRA